MRSDEFDTFVFCCFNCRMPAFPDDTKRFRRHRHHHRGGGKAAAAEGNAGAFRPWHYAPKIELDADDKTLLRAPLHLKLKFKTFGGSAIDLATFQATYIKQPAVDLTARLKPFAQQTGIDIPDAQLPPGEHFIQLGIKDSDGRAVTKIFKLKVAP